VRSSALGTARQLVALLFNPETPRGRWKPQHTVAFKKTSRGHTDLQRDITIAFEVKDAYEKGATYEQAVLEVAENRGLSERQVKRIYAKIKKQASPSP
jgi:hypothetical protein